MPKLFVVRLETSRTGYCSNLWLNFGVIHLTVCFAQRAAEFKDAHDRVRVKITHVSSENAVFAQLKASKAEVSTETKAIRVFIPAEQNNRSHHRNINGFMKTVSVGGNVLSSG